VSLPVVLTDGTGRKVFTRVTADGEQLVTVSPHPPLGNQKARPFRQYLTDDGTAAGSIDMGIDGSSTAVDFWIPADATDDRYITSLNFIVGYGTSGAPYQWADGVALTNGMRLFYLSLIGEVEIHEAIKSNQDMFRLAFSLIPTAWQLRGVGAANDYGYIFSVDFRALGLPNGIRLDRGSTQKLVVRVRDNAGLAADVFNCIGYGFDRFGT
jgi:hypothetical protein